MDTLFVGFDIYYILPGIAILLLLGAQPVVTKLNKRRIHPIIPQKYPKLDCIQGIGLIGIMVLVLGMIIHTFLDSPNMVIHQTIAKCLMIIVVGYILVAIWSVSTELIHKYLFRPTTAIDERIVALATVLNMIALVVGLATVVMDAQNFLNIVPALGVGYVTVFGHHYQVI